MILFSNAKVNLGLRVTEKRSDGYHNIETIMLPVGFSDLLEFIENKENEIVFSNTGIRVDCPWKENLVIKAYDLLRKKFQLPYIKIHLHKFIPPGAGLGGGSSNGAFMLKSLNSYFKLGLDNKQLEYYAAEIGSDCPWFIRNVPCIAEGRGDILAEISCKRTHYIVLLYPGFPVSTKDAYKDIVPQKENYPLNILFSEDPGTWKNLLSNHFEKTVFKLFPELPVIKSALYENGAYYASMSGSGSAMYGLFEKKPVLIESLKKIMIWEGEIMV